MTSLFEIAKTLAALVEQQATALGVPVTISVVDIHGNLVLKHRLPDAPLISLEMSERKAYTAALLDMKTVDLTPLVVPGERMYTLTSVAGGRFVAFGGGAPLRREGRVVAGVGVSGGTTEEDVEVLDAALAALGDESLG
ncbi:MAG: heme-binding protein [Actinomycetota bacterium]|nr:heme-binding protein [Actinomycetota bacterium]